MPASVPDVDIDVVIKKEEIKIIEHCEVINDKNPCGDDVDPINMSVNKDVVSNTRK